MSISDFYLFYNLITDISVEHFNLKTSYDFITDNAFIIVLQKLYENIYLSSNKKQQLNH